jgi:peptide/nickel transport system ATP-binding protein
LSALLEVTDLRVTLQTARGAADALRGVSFAMQRGDTVGLIGESGCGKSITALALMGLLPDGAHIAGSIRFGGQELTRLDEDAMCKLRGARIGMIFQEPMTALNPLHTIGRQIAEPLRLHKGLSAAAARAEALRLLQRVQLPQAEKRLDAYPHQMSGGQRQRAMIALALLNSPALLVADEPTTALDATVQMQVLLILRELQQRLGMGAVFVTHDLGVAAEICDRIAVMYAGRIVEIGPVQQVIHDPQHPYTVGLMGSIPAVGQDVERLPQIEGSMPRLNAIPQGCAFNPRCPRVFDRCRVERPGLMPANKTQAACWLHAVKETALA